MKRVLCAVMIATALTATTVASAQSLPPVRLGVMGGASFATLGGEDVDDADTRTGFSGGASLTIPLRGRLSLEVNALYSQKGAKGSDASESLIFKLDYLELPVLLRYDFTGERVRPFASAGVSFAYRTSCKARGSTEGFTAEFDCDDFADDPEFGLDVNTWDTGVAFGGGLDFPLANDRLFTVGARYTYGLSDVVKLFTVRNRALLVYAGFSIPLR